jgi:predicted nucleic acid-binding protein
LAPKQQPTAGIRQNRLAFLRRLRSKPLLSIDAGTGEVFGQVAAALKTAGKQHRYRVQDLWLASQAIQHGFGLLIRNQRDFDNVPGLGLTLYQLAAGRSH